MKKFVAAIAGLALVVAPANAALRMFFSTTGVAENAEFVAPVSVARSNPAVASGARLFLWAEMIAAPSSQKWNGVSFDVVVNNGRVTANSLYNYQVLDPNGLPGDPPLFVRWQGVNSGTIQANGSVTGANLAAVVSGEGISNSVNAGTYDNQSEIGPINTGTAGTRRALPKAVLLGFYDVALNAGQTAGSVFLKIGNGGIVRSGQAGPESIYLGVGDETAGLLGNSFGQMSPQADATITPEPASLALLGLAALALRRR